MARQQNKSSGDSSRLNQRSLKTPQKIMGGISSGHLDPTTLPKPSLPPWDGWKGVQRDQ